MCYRVFAVERFEGKIDGTTLRASIYTIHTPPARAINMILIKLINSDDTCAFESAGLISLGVIEMEINEDSYTHDRIVQRIGKLIELYCHDIYWR